MVVGLDAFQPVVEPLLQERVFLAPNPGNAGDAVILSATLQLFRLFEVELCGELSAATVVAIGGGGSWGSGYEQPRSYRRNVVQQANMRGLPIIVLPQSVWQPETEPVPSGTRVFFARERASQLLVPGARLGPDIALGYSPTRLPEASFDVGVFLRADSEALFAPRSGQSAGDPVRQVTYERLDKTVYEFFSLAAAYRELVTDRLHFAICGLIAGRRVTLLPNCYHKNRSMYETWLSDIGCHWAEDPSPWLRG